MADAVEGVNDVEARDLNFDPLQPVDSALKLSLIKRWEDATASDKMKIVVCAVCGVRERASKTRSLNASDVDLTLLRNDDLPEAVRPNSYNFTAYDRAILNPKGLKDKDRPGVMIVCDECSKSLELGNMPRLALANWLYYGKDCLPQDIKQEFADASIFERMLIARARCNSICCKFRLGSGTDSSSTLRSLRKGIRGNVIVAPLDAIRLYDVLPPAVSDVRDTMSAVLVADKLPSRSTIEKLAPVLVRKSRIQKLLRFLLNNNPHYHEDTGLTLSMTNLDAIHDAEQTPDVPRSVTIGQLRPEDAYEGVVSDYTPRRADDFIEESGTQDLMMENVSYTEGDESSQAYQTMKLLALEKCLSGKPFLVSGTGNRAVPDFHNPRILAWLFPHLDPWGIGGFHEPRRKIKLSMKEQLSHLLKSDDTTFEEDPEFSSVFFNVSRKAAVSRSARFQVPQSEQERIITEVRSVSPTNIRVLCKKLEDDPKYKPIEPEEKRIIHLLRGITMTTLSLPGSNGYKKMMRDQIRGLIHAKGSPTLFITINPSDVDHPLVRLFGGEDIDLDDILRGEDMDSWRRKVFAAKKPGACALFFDFMIQNFIRIILGYNSGERGLYGVCEAYYGTVEAQGKGTLHCHFLVWLRGHLQPPELRQRLMTSPSYKSSFITWLESIIANEFPRIADSEGDEPDRSQRIRSKDRCEPHPGTVRGPSITRDNFQSEEDFWLHYKEHVVRLLNEYNWHVHTETCFKYLKRGEQRTDSTCRVGMNGILNPETIIDDQTGLIQLRRLHPWIASYTDLVIFLMKCNVNVQFIGSGDAARAFIYYVTDYITKADLPLHEGLAALAYSLKKPCFHGDRTDANSPDENIAAMTKLINAMMGRHEISHQQVMSYLIGGGDHYTSEKFQYLYLGAFLRHISLHLAEQENSVPTVANPDDQEENSYSDQTVELCIEKEDVTVNNQVYDYCFRPTSSPYNSMCLYDFVARTTKTKTRDKAQRKESSRETCNAFSSVHHPQKNTHKLGLRSKRVIPVILGPSIPNRATSSSAVELYSKFMLVMFKPWRLVTDLKTSDETWAMAYQHFEDTDMSTDHRDIAKNMTLLSECRDARLSITRNMIPVEDSRRPDNEEPPESADNHAVADLAVTEDIARWNERYSTSIFSALENSCAQADVTANHSGMQSTSILLQKEVGKKVADALDLCLDLRSFGVQGGVRASATEESTPFVSELHREDITNHRAAMVIKRKRQLESTEATDPARRQKRIRIIPPEPFVTIDVLAKEDIIRNRLFHGIVEEVIIEMNLADNKEQLDAFLTVARHLGTRDTKQLLMFVSGVGGTGKSHVIKSIVKLFERTKHRRSLLIGAPTGSAAVLIGGNTLHSLILENPNSSSKKKNMTLLTSFWKDVSYLIVDEVSMIGAAFLSKVSNTICRAKGDDREGSFKLFGGINVIFMGDLCQLKPVAQRALYSGEISNNPFSEDYASQDRINAMNGIWTWRQVSKIIELVKNCRHEGDPTYSSFLSRLRVGKCLSPNSTQNMTDDYAYLQTRLLSSLSKNAPHELASFANAPIIVGKKTLRDLLNAKFIAFHAKRLRKPVNIYYSKDFSKRERIAVGFRNYLWTLGSSFVCDSLGMLPLFEGMKVMVTENIAFDSKIVNGSEGVVQKIIYEVDEEGRRFATVAYVLFEGIGFNIPGLGQDVVPIFPTRVQVKNTDFYAIGLNVESMIRSQLPLLPAYSYTDFKGQGRTLDKAIVDISTAHSLQSVYVMLSRVKSLSGIAILRWFPPSKLYTRLSDELRTEIKRLGCHM
ncbi:hypothetical protein CVT26_000573 [Gymnopilus dilepis]|uniref:ATP-dependent DNA helicase n=1 Tax=Gymnopilus dilepis TaxID=231916 RepID=A0A409VHC0_9AGAR|nr:hypothetical protein CVT26_000573 [Gymnopilus dilepis]